MNETRKAGITVSLLFFGPLVLCAWILIATWDQHPSTPAEQAQIAADLQRARNARETPVITKRFCDAVCDSIEYQRDTEQRARERDAYRADQQLDEQIRDAANAAATTAVKNAMNGKKPGY